MKVISLIQKYYIIPLIGSKIASDGDDSCPNVPQSVENIRPVGNSSNSNDKHVCKCKLYGTTCYKRLIHSGGSRI